MEVQMRWREAMVKICKWTCFSHSKRCKYQGWVAKPTCCSSNRPITKRASQTYPTVWLNRKSSCFSIRENFLICAKYPQNGVTWSRPSGAKWWRMRCCNKCKIWTCCTKRRPLRSCSNSSSNISFHTLSWWETTFKIWSSLILWQSWSAWTVKRKMKIWIIWVKRWY